MTTSITASLIVFLGLVWPVASFGQTINGLTDRERAQGWQLLFDGKTLNGWHPSAPVQGPGRAGPHRRRSRSARADRNVAEAVCHGV